MSNLTLPLWIILHLLLVHTVDSSRVHYITPSPTTECPGESCLTLATLATKTSSYFDASVNTTFVFLEGQHVLDSDLVVSNIFNVSLMLSDNSSGYATTNCGVYANLEFPTLFSCNQWIGVH